MHDEEARRGSKDDRDYGGIRVSVVGGGTEHSRLKGLWNRRIRNLQAMVSLLEKLWLFWMRGRRLGSECLTFRWQLILLRLARLGITITAAVFRDKF